MFIGREKELKELNSLYDSDQFEFVVLYGRRRVGKTALISRFLEQKNAIYFMGIESNAKQNLENLTQSIFQTGSDSFPLSFLNFQAALEYVFKRAEKERLILAIDEYPYVAKSDKSLASTLQMLIDQYKSTTKLMLILCGSSMAYMQDEVLAYKAPLFGRWTAQMRIDPFDFEDASKFLYSFNKVDQVMLYGMVGGTPQYLQQINNKLSVEENIKRTFLNPASSFFDEPENLLKQEVRDVSTYNAILMAIASGASRMSEISSKVGESSAICSSYLNNLIGLGLIKKEVPFGQKESGRKTLYSIHDPMFRFWFRFIAPNRSLIERRVTNIAYDRIAQHLDEYMGPVFEEICKQYLWKALLKGSSEVAFSDLQRWWGTDSKTKESVEVDIVGAESKHKGLLAECKWRNERIDRGVLNHLIAKKNFFSFTETIFYLFSKNGFTEQCIEEAKRRNDVVLVQYSDMFK